MRPNGLIGLIAGAALSTLTCSAAAQSADRTVVEDFESYEVGEAPHRWKWPHVRKRALIDIPRTPDRDDDFFEVVEEDGSQFARAYTRDETVQIALENGVGYDWSLRRHPRLAWKWRAVRLPEGAREDTRSLNDAGAAVYVVFDCRDWLRRPCSIKYTYSSTLPVGTTHRYGSLQLVVASSRVDGIGDWIRIERNVAEDFRRFFGREAPERPYLITLWGDTDTTHGVSDVHFDTVELLD